MLPSVINANSKAFLIYIDILGFEQLPIQIAEFSKVLKESKIREDFIFTINQKIAEIEQKGDIIQKSTGKDDWLLTVSSTDAVFKVIYDILNHETGYKGFEKIPLEIAVGNFELDNLSNDSVKALICANSTIKFLKSNITELYKKYFEEINNGRHISSSFIVFTQQTYDRLPYFDRQLFEKIVPVDTTKGENSIFYFIDEPKMIHKGKLLAFLGNIGKSNNPSFLRIDSAFVAPNEYEDIVNLLEQQKVIFLIGDPEIGKTFTAARLLWDYFLKGYYPIWHPGTEQEERAINRQELSEGTILNSCVVYFEDPFGKRRFEDREELRRVIGATIARIKQKNVRVIISSREEIFREFQRETLSTEDFSKYTIEMRLMKPSYTNEKMTEILLNWANEVDCNWLNNQVLKFYIFCKAIGKVVTPLGLWDFACSSKECIDINEIDNLLIEKSKAVRASFSEEIAQMTKEKVLFLSLVAILGENKSETIRPTFNKLVDLLKLGFSPIAFERTTQHFSSKVTLEKKGWRKNPRYAFTHPSYEDAVFSSWNRDEVKPFIIDILTSLVKDSDLLIRGCTGLCLIKNFNDILFKKEAKRIIDEVLHDKKSLTRIGVALGLEMSFKNIAVELGTKFVYELLKDKNGEIRSRALSIINNNFDLVPIQDCLEIIGMTLNDRASRVRYETVSCVINHFDSIPIEIIQKARGVIAELSNSSIWLIGFLSEFTQKDLEERIASGAKNR
jgi:hypothetical protein